MSRLDTDNVLFPCGPRSEDAIVEISVLLESGLLDSLEEAARAQSLTLGALMRRLLRDVLGCSPSETPVVVSENRETASPC